MSDSLPKPNILLITTDTQRTDTLRCMGSAFAHSPNLDRLAREGVLFTRAYTASPACMPARCSILSGLHTPLHGCVENGVERYADMPVFTDALKRLGYHTILVGKSHFGAIPQSFDIHETTRGEKGSCKNDDFTRSFCASGDCEASRHPNGTPREFCLDSMIVNRTLYHMKNSRRDGRPFFAFCSLLSPHSPLDPPGDWAAMYSPRDIPPAAFREREWEELPQSLRQLCGLPRRTENSGWIDSMVEGIGNIADEADNDEICRYKALYYGSAAYCDAQVGRLIDYLDISGLRENTLVIFTSDHGQQYFDHGFNDKHNYYEQSLHVPLIFSMPFRLPQGETRTFASGTDLAPSILGAAGASYLSANGFDLFTPLAQGRPLPRCHATASILRSMALVSERWKLEYYIDDQAARLFDLQSDPGETCNLAGQAEYEPIRAALTEALLLWRAQLIDVVELNSRLSVGGPVAKRATQMLKQITGGQCEERLSETVRRLNLSFSSVTR